MTGSICRGEIRMKKYIWVDDIRPMPSGYDYHCRSVNETKNVLLKLYRENEIYLDLDHDSGDYCTDGGDYIRILDFIEEYELNKEDTMEFHIHSMNPVGAENMRSIIYKNGWIYR